MNKFLIDHIDPLGQGVFKKNEDIYFIPKTLPGEEGEFSILKKKKGVHFAQVEKITKFSPKRVEAECKHFGKCSGCHFLHTDHEFEIELKKKTFERWLKDIEHPKLKVLSLDQRLHYRNRIQLHYEKNMIGFKISKTNQILPVPYCKIMRPKLYEAFQDFLAKWKELRIKLNQPVRGHVELYLQDDETVKINWNEDYAAGGFTQVHSELNLQVQAWIKQRYPKLTGGLLELFGGQGNLSREVDFDRRICVDLYDSPKPDQINLNLFDQSVLSKFLSTQDNSFETIFVDPPRSGFKGLPQWINHYKPKQLFYMSCNPITQINDLKSVDSQFEITDILLVDFFPSTFHFESIIAMQKK